MNATDFSVFGYFYSHRAEGLTGSEEDPKDPDYVAKICYTSAIVYAAFVVFCGLQVGVVFLRVLYGLELYCCTIEVLLHRAVTSALCTSPHCCHRALHSAVSSTLVSM